MPGSTPTDGLRRLPPLAFAWLLLVLVAMLVRLPVLLWRGAEQAASRAPAVERVLTLPPGLRIERATGLPARLMTALRELVPEDARLVVYSPYGGVEFTNDLSDPRGEPSRQVLLRFEQLKNLLYPKPRDVCFAREPDELLAKLAGPPAGGVFVVDGTQGPEVLTTGGEYELLAQAAFGGSGQLRLWRLRRHS